MTTLDSVPTSLSMIYSHHEYRGYTSILHFYLPSCQILQFYFHLFYHIFMYFHSLVVFNLITASHYHHLVQCILYSTAELCSTNRQKWITDHFQTFAILQITSLIIAQFFTALANTTVLTTSTIPLSHNTLFLF